MLQALRYIILFLIGYKIFKMLFGQNENRKSVSPSKQTPPLNNTNSYHQDTYQKPTHSNFDDAELIDYEEVK